MIWLEVVLVAAVLVAVALVAAGAGDRLRPAEPGFADPGLPDGELGAEDIARLRFRVVLRGYRMDEVDAALDRVAERMRELELRSRPAPAADPVADPTPDPAVDR